MQLVLWAMILIGGSRISGEWKSQTLETNADFRGVCAVSPKVAWVSGTLGTVARTTDGGATWQVVAVPGAEKLDFRDVEAFDERTAYVLSIGPGGDSRIYKTTDGGKSWTEQFRNADPDAFYDALAFWDRDHGLALSDPVKGRFRILTTDDGGATWRPIAEAGMPAALPGEGAFAASGTCLLARGQGEAWFVTGGAKVARLFRSTDRGKTWVASELPIPAGAASAGAFSVAFRDLHGVVVGGDYRKPKDAGPHAAVSLDGGRSWKTVLLPFRSGVTWAGDRWVAVGTSGSHESRDGVSWQIVDTVNYNAVSFTQDGEGWAVGPKGRIARYVK